MLINVCVLALLLCTLSGTNNIKPPQDLLVTKKCVSSTSGVNLNKKQKLQIIKKISFSISKSQEAPLQDVCYFYSHAIRQKVSLQESSTPTNLQGIDLPVWFSPIPQNSLEATYEQISSRLFEAAALQLNASFTPHTDSCKKCNLIGTPSKYRAGYSVLAQLPTSPIEFIYRTPALAFLENVYPKPFLISSWLSLLLFFVVGITVLYVMVLVHHSVSGDIECDLSFSDIVMMQCSNLFQKCSDFHLKSCSGRMALTFLYVTLMVISSFYTASIVIYLKATFQESQQFSDLFSSGIRLGVENVSEVKNVYLVTPLENTEEELLRRKMVEKYPKDLFFTTAEGIKKVRSEFFAFETRLEPSYDLVHRTFYDWEKCSLRTTRGFHFYDTQNRFLLVKRDWAFANALVTWKLTESGIKHRLYYTSISFRPKCFTSNESNFSGSGLTETQFVFQIFLCGLVLSFCIFLGEWCVHEYTNSLRFLRHYDRCARSCGCVRLQPYVD